MILLGLLFENVRQPLQFLKPAKFNTNEQESKLDVYKQIPFKKNKIILEIPFYFTQRYKNSEYMLNWIHHQNYLLNGKVSIRPEQYLAKLQRTIGAYQNSLFRRPRLNHLIKDFSVNYVIIHLNKLKYYLPKKFEFSRQRLIGKINSLPEYCRIIYQDDSHLVVKIKEFFPINRIVRTFSYYHLKKKKLFIRFKDPYNGKIQVFINKKLINTLFLTDDQIFVDLKDQQLEISENKVELVFDKKIYLDRLNLQ